MYLFVFTVFHIYTSDIGKTNESSLNRRSSENTPLNQTVVLKKQILITAISEDFVVNIIEINRIKFVKIYSCKWIYSPVKKRKQIM